MKIKNVKNPKWADIKHSAIIVDLDIDEQAIPFVASPNDCTDYGPKIYQDCIDGKYGDIAEFSVPEKTPEQLEDHAKAELDRRLNAVMTTENQALAVVDDEFKKNYKSQIKALLDVKKQKGWPDKIVWPKD